MKIELLSQRLIKDVEEMKLIANFKTILIREFLITFPKFQFGLFKSNYNPTLEDLEA